MLTAGIIFIAAGLIGLALPFLQGILFLIIGSILLSISSAKVRAWTESHTRRYPKLHKLVERTEKWIVRIIGTVDPEEHAPDSDAKE